MKPTDSAGDRSLSGLILGWYDRWGRRLPWRETRDPYPILVSEIMLQQTQVSRVIPYFHRWLERFPSWKDLAEAPTADLIRAWSGLGYNRRALVLQSIARDVERNGVPRNEEEWLALKGIGPYTAAALTVFALRKRAVPIDTNIRRIGGRIFLGRLFPEPASDHELRDELSRLIRATPRFYDLVQALFDLASSICLKRPLCPSCPLVQSCPAAPLFARYPDGLPPSPVKKPKERRHPGKPYPDRIYRGRILREVGQRPEGVPLSGLGPVIDPDFSKTADSQWLNDMIKRLIADQLIISRGRKLFLP